MTYNRVYPERLNFVNDTEPALNETNLNKLDYAVYKHDEAIQDLDGRILTGQQAYEAKEESKDYSETSEAWAIGKRDGADVPSGDVTYNNNSKYYAEQAQNSATSASESASNAANAARDEVARVVADAPESFDTLKEISDWIADHADDASAMNSAILQNTGDIESLQNSKQNKTDNTLTTTNKTVTGAINEVNGNVTAMEEFLSNFTIVDNKLCQITRR